MKDRLGQRRISDPPIHFGEFLRLVDHDVAVGPITVCGSAFGEVAGVALDEAVREVLGVEHVLREQLVLILHQILAADHKVQHAGRILGLGLPFPLGCVVCGLVAADQVDQLVE